MFKKVNGTRSRLISNTKVLIFFTSISITACGGGGGGEAKCGPNPYSGTLSDLAGEQLTINNCKYTYTNTNNDCVVRGTLPYGTSVSGTVNITISSYTAAECGALPSVTSCDFNIMNATRIDVICVDLNINDSFYTI